MNREKRIGLMGSQPIGAGYIRDIERKAKRLSVAVDGRKEKTRQLRLPRF